MLTIAILSGIGVAIGLLLGFVNSAEGKTEGNNGFLAVVYIIAQWQFSQAWGITVLVTIVLLYIITGLIASANK